MTVVDALSNNDPTKWQEICEWSVIEFLNTMSYYRDKQKHLEHLRWQSK